tara:strand:+ start:78 stop:734 length:657 start_codon:yes stop_codon:yes gene_type:complete
MSDETENTEEKASEQEAPKEAPVKEEQEKAAPPAEEKKEEASAEAEEKTEAAAKEESKDGDNKEAKEGEEGEQSEEEKKEETAEDLLGANIEQVKVRKAKGSKNVTNGICHVIATFNNTKVTFSDLRGNVVSWSSSGKCNFRGSRKSTAYAAQVVTQDAGRVAMSHGMKEVIVKVKGPGMGRDSAIRSLQSLGFKVSTIIDVTPVPHNGCRPPKRRRV